MAKIVPVHPGEVLQGLYLEPTRTDATHLAQRLDVDASRIAELIGGRGRIDADIAHRLARHYRTNPRYWLNMQDIYDLYVAEQRNGAAFARIEPMETEAA